MRIATFDLGTNTVLASVVERSDVGTLALISDRAMITRLGEGVDRARALSPEGVRRTLSALTTLAAEARSLGAARLIGVGTSALRDAENRDDLVLPARRILDRFDVIDGRREAALTFIGAFFGIAWPSGSVTVVDIGGGSTEIALGRDGRVAAAVSLDVGSVRLFERHLRAGDRPSAPALAALHADIDRALEGRAISPPLVMVAGTATNVAAVALGRDLRAGAAVPHGEMVSSAALRVAVARITSASREERRSMVGLETGREDVIVAGALLLEQLVVRASADTVTISDGGVRLGLAIERLDRRTPEPC